MTKQEILRLSMAAIKERAVIKWIRETDKLPPIAQPVFYAAPRQGGEFWDVSVSRILVRHEGVFPRPVKAGTKWPTEFWWCSDHFGRSTHLVTGNGYWAAMDDIPLPPGAEHKNERGQHWVAQIGECFIEQAAE